MRIGIVLDVERPRLPTLLRGWRGRALLLVLIALGVAAPVAWASHTFSDVPPESPHHADVTAIKNAGITAGCNPPTNTLYCPEQAVRRDQMASFLRRGLGRVTQGSGPVLLVGTGEGSSPREVAASATITVPGTAGTQFVSIIGSASLFVNVVRSTACFGTTICNIYLALHDGPTQLAESLVRISSDYGGGPAVVTAVVPVAAGTTKTFTLEAYTFNVNNDVGIVYRPRIVATTFPFGGTGGSTLSADASASTAAGADGDIARGSSG